MQGEPADKLPFGQRHKFDFCGLAVVFVAEGDLPVFDLFKTVVGYGCFMGIAAQIFNDLFRSQERPFGINHPSFSEQSLENRIGNINTILLDGLSQQGYKFSPENQAHSFYGKQEFTL